MNALISNQEFLQKVLFYCQTAQTFGKKRRKLLQTAELYKNSAILSYKLVQEREKDAIIIDSENSV